MATFEIDAALRGYSADDFETASVRSAAPSYVSEVPSYHTTISNGEAIPPYSPPANNNNSSSNNNNNNSHSISGATGGPGPGVGSRTHSLPTLLPSNTAHLSSPGLPPIPPASHRSHSDPPTLGAFRIPSWSTVNTNPTYQRVATRRAQAAMSSMSSGEGLLRNAARALERVNEEVGSGGGAGSGSGSGGGGAGTGTGAGVGAGASGAVVITPGEADRVRPLEDPYLVGEEAAARARRERLARENGDDVLQREDRRWDWFLAQQRDWDERERSWKHFRRSMGSASGMSRGRLARRLAAGGR